MNRKLERIKLKIVEKCTNCGGSGCSTCKAKCVRLQKYSDCKIPSFFWDKSIKKFAGNKILKSKIQDKLRDLNDWYDEGSSLILVGGLGTGKSYVSCCCLKIAVTSGFSALYTSMVEVISKIISERDAVYIEKIMNVDFLVVDEFDSRWIFPSDKSEQMFSANMEYVLRTRFQNGLPTIICSNTSNIDEVLKGYHSKAFSSLKSKYAETIYIPGGDLRRKYA